MICTSLEDTSQTGRRPESWSSLAGRRWMKIWGFGSTSLWDKNLSGFSFPVTRITLSHRRSGLPSFSPPLGSTLSQEIAKTKGLTQTWAKWLSPLEATSLASDILLTEKAQGWRDPFGLPSRNCSRLSPSRGVWLVCALRACLVRGPWGGSWLSSSWCCMWALHFWPLFTLPSTSDLNFSKAPPPFLSKTGGWT